MRNNGENLSLALEHEKKNITIVNSIIASNRSLYDILLVSFNLVCNVPCVLQHGACEIRKR